MAGYERAKKDKVELVIHDRDGQIRQPQYRRP